MPPTATDQQLADRLAELRADFAGFRSGVETELRIIRKLATWLLGGVFSLVAMLITGAATVAWSASAVVSDVKHQAERLDKLDARLDAIGKQLDTLISRTAPGPGPRPAAAPAEKTAERNGNGP